MYTSYYFTDSTKISLYIPAFRHNLCDNILSEKKFEILMNPSKTVDENDPADRYPVYIYMFNNTKVADIYRVPNLSKRNL